MPGKGGRGIRISINVEKKTISTKLLEFLPKEEFDDFRQIHTSLGFRFSRKTKSNYIVYDKEDFEQFAEEYIKLMKNRFKDKVRIEKR
ncbi:MAG: hypothetical protein GXO42_00960 [bacterium]|nr:hypothetical protein [bacterium]